LFQYYQKSTKRGLNGLIIIEPNYAWYAACVKETSETGWPRFECHEFT